MDYKNIIEQIGKYHYIISTSSKTLLLGSSNRKNEARDKALEKIKPILNNVQGKIIYLLTIRKISKKDLKKQEGDTLKVLGGPIEVTIEKVEVISGNKLKNLGGFKNNRVYFSDKYLHNNMINNENIKKIAYDYHNEKLKSGPFDLNIIN
jgi:hypothetical protein